MRNQYRRFILGGGLCETRDSNTSHGSKLIYLIKGLRLSLHKEIARTEPKTPLEFIDVAQKEERFDQLHINPSTTKRGQK
ncbi:unnamed protein product [Didymodactylos carnosus]|uniref:Uncharacterized protein n=1 Tax=Didymodactylos carnosus TaxID=1234261 RepID=A0A8S2QQ50_9BILA|nr:unnamed protein product [Didymodactylos carnosus]CAF4106665.1 unnamed protein product [Didymodactylos carnosus]